MLEKTSNPVFSSNVFQEAKSAFSTTGTMTMKGTINKSLLLLGIILVTAVITWRMSFSGNAYAMPLMFGGLIVGFIFSLITTFKPEKAHITAPIYAVCEGLVLGGISAMYALSYGGEDAGLQGIVFNAIMLTIGVFAVMLYLYKERIIQPTRKFMIGLLAATGAICIVYLIDLVMGFFGSSIGFLHSSGPLGIGISLIIVAVAALNLILDFKNVEDGVNNNAPVYMEWYCAFGLMVTLVWLYMEILRLLSKFSSRD